MPAPARFPLPGRTRLLLSVLCACLAAAGSLRTPAAPVVPGVAASRLDPWLKGLVLVEELGCAACHAGGDSLAARSRRAPRLAGLSDRMDPAFLKPFLLDPHGSRPGTSMPDLLAGLDDASRPQAAEALVHFLMSSGTGTFAPQAPDAVAAGLGRQLFHSRGCAQCHAPRDEHGRELPSTNSVPLGPLEHKHSVRSLVAFLGQPHAVRPSGRMPDLRLAGRDAERIAHYLLQETRVPGALGYTLYRGEVWEGFDSDKVTPERAGLVKDFSLQSLGGVPHHTAIRYEGWIRTARRGPHQFHLRMNGGRLEVDGKELARLDPSDRRGVKALEGTADLGLGWHRIRLDYFHTGHDPAFAFEVEGPDLPRQPVAGSMLSVSDQPIPAFEPFRTDPGLVARGRALFGTLGCANCHDDLQVPARPAKAFAALDASRGCLGTAPGPWPRFGLTAEQRAWIAQAMPRAERPPLDDRQRVDKTLTALNCIACHERAGLGGIDPQRTAFFTGSQPALGDQGRLPPPLTHVGAKLRPEWIAEVLLRGRRQRPYLDASMPQFGEANVGHLVEGFGRVDTLESAPIPPLTDLKEAKEAGREMVGSGGMSCIACHEYNGQKSGETGAVDLAFATGRLQKNWFHLYLRQPSRFHPTVIMPSYWPDGQSVRPNLLGGDAGRQIEALWAYLADGGRARKPDGLSRVSNELRVGDVPEICRGQSPIGYRGMAVGYPERVNLAFDTGEMALRRLWKGEFAGVDNGTFHPRGTDPVEFPPGIPFHRLRTPDENWPYKGKSNHGFPQDHGYQFRGYHLDAARRPTLLYRYGNVAVRDLFEDVRDADGRAYFRRTLRFEAPAGEAPFAFRTAVGRQVTATEGRRFGVGRLDLRIASDHRGTVREGEPGEVLIPLALPAGTSTLVLEYRW